MTIADLTSGYVTSCPQDFPAEAVHRPHRGAGGSPRVPPGPGTAVRKRVLGTVVSTACGMAFNVVADPVVGYFYKTYVLGVPQDAAATWAKIGAVTTPGERRGGRGSRQRLLPGPPPRLGTCRPAEKGRLIVSVKMNGAFCSPCTVSHIIANPTSNSSKFLIFPFLFPP